MIVTVPQNPLAPLTYLGDVLPLLIATIKTKEYSSLGLPFIAYHLEHHLRLRPKDVKRLQEPKAEQSAAFTRAVKAVRAQARPIFSVFEQKSREDAVGKYLSGFSDDRLRDLLITHKSTQERLPFYSEFIDWVAPLLPTDARILDIAAGLNPVAFLHHTSGVARYDTVEVSDDTAQLYEDICTYHGCAHKHIITHFPVYYDQLPLETYDLTFALKTFDTLEQQKRHMTVKFLGTLRSDFLLASFSMKTIKGDEMKREQAGWFIRVTRQLGAEITAERQFGDELCYLVDLRAAR